MKKPGLFNDSLTCKKIDLGNFAGNGDRAGVDHDGLRPTIPDPIGI
jgi:hypothetical protein